MKELTNVKIVFVISLNFNFCFMLYFPLIIFSGAIFKKKKEKLAPFTNTPSPPKDLILINISMYAGNSCNFQELTYLLKSLVYVPLPYTQSP